MPTTYDALGTLLDKYTTPLRGRHAARERWELIDRYMQRSVDTSAEGAAGKAAAAAGRRDKHRNLELPIVLQQVETAHADLVGTFLTGYPVFAFVGAANSEQSQDVALMYSVLCERDQERFGWVTNLQVALRDALLKDVLAVECVYTQRESMQLVAEGGKRATKSVRYSGQQLKRIDPYNLYFDTTTPLEQLSESGAYIGYVERKNYLQVKMLLAGFDKRFAQTAHFGNALSAGGTSGLGLYFAPDLHPMDTARTGPDTNWEAYFGHASQNAQSGARGCYEVFTMYARIIPREFGIRAQRDGTPTPYKLVWVGNVLVYIEPLAYAHGLLPIAISHANTTGLGFENRAFAENQLDMQDVGTSMMNGVIASMRRAVSDRAVYNPLLLDPKDVNSANPAAKMALKPAAFQLGIEAAYRAIPYEDRTSPFLAANMQTVLSLSNNVSGLNPAAQGAFVKGNKTREEFSTVMGNSDARMKRYALDLENSFFSQLKRMLKMNYMQFAELESIFSRSEQAVVDIDPTALLLNEADFRVVDALNPASKVMNTEGLVAAYNTIAQAPELDMEYSRADIFAALLKAQGVDISQYKRSPEERAAMQQAAAAQQQQQPQPGAPQ